MGICACGCGGTARKTWIHGHNFTQHGPTLEERRARSKRIAASRPKSYWREMGAKGGATSNIRRWSELLEIWLDKTPREAVHVAYTNGYHAGYQAGVAKRVRRARREAA